MGNDALKNDLLNQKKVHETKIDVLQKSIWEVQSELRQRKSMVKSIDRQLDKLDGKGKSKTKKSKKDSKPQDKPTEGSATAKSETSQDFVHLHDPNSNGPQL